MMDPGLVDDDSQRCKPLPASLRPALVARIGALVAATAAALGCGDNHNVSPWGPGGRPSLAAFQERPDLDRYLARTAEELRALGLDRSAEYEAENDDVPFVAWRGAPDDPTAWSRVSTRIITPYGVVFGAGPSDVPDRTQANDLAVAEGLTSPFFLLKARRRVLAVLLRAADGHFAVFLLTPYGSTEVGVESSVVPTRALDFDGDGYVDLVGEITLADTAGTRLPVVATFDGVSFDDRSADARALHARRAAAEPREGTAPDVASALRLWHRAASGALTEKELASSFGIAFAERTDPWLVDLRAALVRMVKRQQEKKPSAPPQPASATPASSTPVAPR